MASIRLNYLTFTGLNRQKSDCVKQTKFANCTSEGSCRLCNETPHTAHWGKSYLSDHTKHEERNLGLSAQNGTGHLGELATCHHHHHHPSRKGSYHELVMNRTLRPTIAVVLTAIMKIEARRRLLLIRPLLDVCVATSIILEDIARDLILEEGKVERQECCDKEIQ